MSELGFRPTVSEAVMSLPLCCGWCGEPGRPNHESNIITCARCEKQTSADVAEEHRTRRYEALDRLGGWSLDEERS